MISRFFLLILISIFTITPVLAGENFTVSTNGSRSNLEARKKLIEEILGADSMRFGYSALSIIIDANQVEPRGKMQWHAITLSATVNRDSEFIKLLVHEIGHYVDVYSLVSGNNGSDPSDTFYGISWQDKTTKKANETLSSFVSGYAATNKYEDFAESFTFYIFHNREFADRALKNESLRQKYIFFSNSVFPAGEFTDTDFRVGKIPGYLWDTTKIPISVQKYLYSLQ